MKPVVIFRHAQCEGAGYLGTFLKQQNIPMTEVRIDLGEVFPTAVDTFSGLAFMGGPMSVNDDLPWISQATSLIRKAMSADVPVLGHCLGGQLMSKALGMEITKNPVQEIGWGEVNILDNADAKKWFGESEAFLSFHWHGETFSLPEDATLLLSSDYCENQAYAIGKHLAMQCHVEMTEEMINKWYGCWNDQVENAIASPGVQSEQEMLEDLTARVEILNRQAQHVYSVWVKGLQH